MGKLMTKEKYLVTVTYTQVYEVKVTATSINDARDKAVSVVESGTPLEASCSFHEIDSILKEN